VRKPEATRDGRLFDPAIATPRNAQLREVLLDLIESELSFHSRSPPNGTPERLGLSRMTRRQVVDKWVTDLRIDSSAAGARSSAS
jgi:hypothetical protein